MSSILKVKSDLDPFELYDDLDKDNVDCVNSTRMKLAMLKASNKLDDDEVIDQANHELEQVMELEQEPIKVIVMPKLDMRSEEKLLETIQATFSQIFQALIVMLEDKALFTQLPNEAEKTSKRSREFEVRLNRSVFETKQQVNKN